MNRVITIEIRNYEAGEDPDQLTLERIEGHFTAMLERDGSDGVVVVSERISPMPMCPVCDKPLLVDGVYVRHENCITGYADAQTGKWVERGQ